MSEVVHDIKILKLFTHFIN